jgi:hypothetical protein
MQSKIYSTQKVTDKQQQAQARDWGDNDTTSPNLPMYKTPAPF